MKITIHALSFAVSLMALSVLAEPNDEIMRTTADRWGFETSVSKTPFVPFGVNFVLNEKRYLNLFGPGIYDRERYERLLAALEGLRFNTVKVFLPIAQVLPDPQVPGEARIAPGYLDNLEDFLRLAHRHQIRVVVCLACWGGNDIKWWHEGGEYFGRQPWRTDPGIDSLDVLTRFWKQLGARLRDNPAIFSYSPTVEWTFPAGNLTRTPPTKQSGRLETEPGLFYWRAFLQARYGSIAELNRAYGTAYNDFHVVSIVDFTYDTKARRYADPAAKILDYQNFREWASRRYFKPQLAAIRAADPRHMVTISNHAIRAIGLWEGAARIFTGFEVPEQSDMVDYLVTHDNRSESELKRGQTIEDVLHDSILQARLCNARARLPLIVEEFTFASSNAQRVAEGQAKMVLGTVGHVSGWMNWYLQYPHEPNEADTPGADRSAVLDDEFRPTPWGLRARDLIAQLRTNDLSRLPPKTTIQLDRQKELVPVEMGTQLRICQNWTNYQHPIDFNWPSNRWIDLELPKAGVPAASQSALSMKIYQLPQGEVAAPISITAGGLPLPVSLCYVSAYPYNRRWPGHQRTTDQREVAYFARLAAKGPITFRYTPARAFSVCTVRPLSAKVTPTVKDGTITFTLPRAGGYSVELDGLHNALHLFLDPPMNYSVSPDARGVRYFGAGVHRIGILHLKDDETVYIDEGAVVYGCIHGDGVHRVRILGRGILDNSENVEEILRKVDQLGDGSVDVRNSRREHTIHLINSSDIEIEGITIRDSLCYNIACFGCSNIAVKNCKIIGCWRYNTDGIDFHNCRNARVADCFVRTYDDSLCAKGHPGYRYDTCEDILFENCVVWNDWGKALEIGAETSAEHLRRITFRDCDVIHATHPAIDIMNVDYGRVHDVLFDDIRIEYDSVSQRPAMQKNDETPFVVDPRSTYMPLAVCFNIQKHPEYSNGLERRGYVYDIKLRNIRIYADRMPSSSLYGYDEEHPISDITVDGFFLGDRRITNLEEAGFRLGKHTRNVKFR